MESIYKESITETLYYSKHESGLDIYILPKPDYSQYFGCYAVQYGSIDCEFLLPGGDKSIIVPDGIAHFLEHKMFEQEEGNVFDDYAKLGSSLNAYTNFTTTAYLFLATENIKENLALLFKSVNNPYFTDQSIEKEKGIISQEIKMYQDNPNSKIYFNLLDCLYVKHPVKKQIAGTLDSILQINKDLLYECYDSFYKPSNASFIMVGNVNPDEIYNIIDSYLSKKSHNKVGKSKRIYPHEPGIVNNKRIEEKLKISTPLFAIGFKDIDIGYNGRELLKKEIETLILLEGLFGRSSLLFRKLYDMELINNTFGSDYIGEKDYGYSMLGGESKSPDEVYKIIGEYINNKGIKDFNETVFKRIKKKFIGQFLFGFNSIEYIGSNFISYHMKKINILDYLEIINEIQYQDIDNRFYSHLDNKNMVISIIGVN